MNTIKCSQCECELTDNDGIHYSTSDEPFCDQCEGETWKYASSVLTTHNGVTTKYLWTSEFGFRDAEWWEERSPNGVKGFKYVRTDAWRGYFDPIIEDGYTTLASGWSTGKYDDVSWKHAFNDFVDEIGEGKRECPFEIIFAFGLTSNVFSIASDIIIRESDLDEFTEWIAEETGYTIDQLQKALI